MPALFLDSTLVLSLSAQAVDVDVNGSVVLFAQGPDCVNASKSTSQRPAV